MKEKILETIQNNMPDGYDLLYAAITGSRLYGTHNENSDTDVKFIFKPSLEDCILGIASRNLNMNTSNDKEANSKDDIDIQGWSIQFFLDLLRKGDTNAIDVLYSISNTDCVVYYPEKRGNTYQYSMIMEDLFSNPLAYFDLSNMRGLLGYVVSMSDKYGLKGSRYSKLLEVSKVTDEEVDKMLFTDLDPIRLEDIYEKILEKCGDNTFCKYEVCQDKRKAIRLGGKVHLLEISIHEFMRRLDSELNRYGERSKKSLDGSDWKALSHAYRGIVQIAELLVTYNLNFPLQSADVLKEIKEGKLSMENVNEMISSGLQIVEDELKTTKRTKKEDHTLTNKTILDLYGV